MNYQQSNWLFREVMPTVKNKSTFAVIAAVADATWGWNTEKAELSISDLAKASGISEGSVRNVFKDDDFQNYITQEPIDPTNLRLGYRYYVNFCHSAMLENIIVPSKNSHSTPAKSSIDTSSALKEETKKDKEGERTGAYEIVLETWESSPLPLKFSRSQFEREFTTKQLDTLWPYSLAFQESCDMPSDIAKFYANLWEVMGYDTMTPDDIRLIAAELRAKRPDDNVWPSNVITEWRKRQLIGVNTDPLTAQAKEDFKRFADLPKLSRQEQSARLQSLPAYLKTVYNALSQEWRKTPTESEFVQTYQRIVPTLNGATAHA